MSYNNGPRIVTNGLVLCLDAANSKSYPGSGTAWSDLSGNNNNGILTNGPTFNSSNNGIISLDGTNDFIDIGNKTSLILGTGDFCFDIWLRIPSVVAFGAVLSCTDSTTPHPAGSYQIGFGSSGGNFTFIQPALTITSNIVFPLNKWVNLIVTRNSNITTMYFDTVSVGSATHTVDMSNYIYYVIGRNRNFVLNPIFLNMTLGSARIYKNKGLNTSEILQNYNATKGRFGL